MTMGILDCGLRIADGEVRIDVVHSAFAIPQSDV